MDTILVVFESRFGQSATIAEHIVERVRDRGLVATILHVGVACGADLDRYAGVVVVAPLHFGEHPASVRKFLRSRVVALSGRSLAIVSVNNASASADPAGRARAERGAERLVAETGVRPDVLVTAGGALSYPRYGTAMRLLVKLDAFAKGLPTDTSTVHELTDWVALDEALAPFYAAFDALPPNGTPSPDESGVHRLDVSHRGVVHQRPREYDRRRNDGGEGAGDPMGHLHGRRRRAQPRPDRGRRAARPHVGRSPLS